MEKNIENMLKQINSVNIFEGMTYFLRGEKSKHIQEADFVSISTLFPNYKIIDIQNAGHWVHVDEKEFFLNTIKTILN